MPETDSSESGRDDDGTFTASVSPSDILAFFRSDHDLPIITVSHVTDRFDISDDTARDRLETLVEEGSLTKEKIDGRSYGYFATETYAPDDNYAVQLLNYIRDRSLTARQDNSYYSGDDLAARTTDLRRSMSQRRRLSGDFNACLQWLIDEGFAVRAPNYGYIRPSPSSPRETVRQRISQQKER